MTHVQVTACLYTEEENPIQSRILWEILATKLECPLLVTTRF